MTKPDFRPRGNNSMGIVNAVNTLSGYSLPQKQRPSENFQTAFLCISLNP